MSTENGFHNFSVFSVTSYTHSVVNAQMNACMTSCLDSICLEHCQSYSGGGIGK